MAEEILIESKNLAALTYHDDERLDIKFRNGTVYHIQKFPRGVLNVWMEAPSKGQYFNTAIRPNFKVEPKASVPDVVVPVPKSEDQLPVQESDCHTQQ